MIVINFLLASIFVTFVLGQKLILPRFRCAHSKMPWGSDQHKLVKDILALVRQFSLTA